MTLWTLQQVWSACPSAVPVWVELNEMAARRGSAVVTPTRQALADATGIAVKTVSAALTTLDKAGWIERQQVQMGGPNGWSSMLRIVLRRSLSRVSTAHKKSGGRRSRSRVATAVGPVDPVQGYLAAPAVDPVQGYLTSLTEKGDAAAPSLRGGDSTPEQQEHPAVRIERERMAEIKAKRLASHQIQGHTK